VPSPGDAGREAPGHVVHRPRVTYRGRLVLARRRWTLPQALFPGRDRRGERGRLFPSGEERFITEMILQMDFPENADGQR